jgi:hypothetical protein
MRDLQASIDISQFNHGCIVEEVLRRRIRIGYYKSFSLKDTHAESARARLLISL